MSHMMMVKTHPFWGTEESDRLPSVNSNSDDEGESQAKIDIKDIGTNGVWHSHISISIAGYKHRTHSVLDKIEDKADHE